MSLLAAAADPAPSILWQGLAFILGLPLVYIALGEVAHRLRAAGHPLHTVLRATRTLALPPLAAWIVARHFFDVTPDSTALRLVQTAFWIAVALILLLFLGNLVSHGKPARNWQVSMPNLLFQFLRALLVFAALTYLLAAVWKIDVTKIMGTLGIGSLVIALALQDTLSNLVSGFLLIIESPFKVGDWIKVGDTEGEVVEINWRAVRIRTLDRDIVVIPNGNLGKEKIINFVLGDPLHAVRLSLPLSAKDHPDRVRHALRDAALSIDGILPQPAPRIDPKEYHKGSITYEARFFVTDYPRTEEISREFLSRAYYAIRRAGLVHPVPDSIEEVLPATEISATSSAELLPTLQAQPLFAHLDRPARETLAATARIELFGEGERIVTAGRPDTAFHILLGGRVSLSSATGQTLTHLGEGDFLGEMVLLPGEKSKATAEVRETATVLRIDPAALNALVQKHPRFALEISQFIDERRKLLRTPDSPR
jgi:small-conductance mechanosensitive channel